MNNEETIWFPHNKDTHTTPEMSAMLNRYGLEGYGAWNLLMEVLRGEVNYKFDIARSFGYEVLATAMRITSDRVREILNDFIEVYKILQTDGTYIWSEYLTTKMEYWENRKKVLSERGKRGAAITNAKRLAQAKNSDGTPALVLDNSDGTSTLVLNDENGTSVKVLRKESAQNNTEHNRTVQNTTEHNKTQQEETPVVANASSTNTHANWNEHKTHSLADQSFAYRYLSAGLSNQGLGCWLDAFNRMLASKPTEPKTNRDYQNHFGNWIKFHNTLTEDPAKLCLPRAASPPAIDPLAYLKSPAEIQADLDRHYEERKKNRRAS